MCIFEILSIYIWMELFCVPIKWCDLYLCKLHALLSGTTCTAIHLSEIKFLYTRIGGLKKKIHTFLESFILWNLAEHRRLQFVKVGWHAWSYVHTLYYEHACEHPVYSLDRIETSWSSKVFLTQADSTYARYAVLTARAHALCIYHRHL